MKKNNSIFKIVGSMLLLSTVLVGFGILQRKTVFAEESIDSLGVSEEVTEDTANVELIDDEIAEVTPIYENPTIQAALEIAREYPDYWESMFDDGRSNESSTILVMPEGAFIQGVIELETGETWDSDTDPNATTLGEILVALRENGLDPFE